MNNTFFGFMKGVPIVTRNLLIINIGIWLLGTVMPSFNETILYRLGLHYWEADAFNPIQFITYMFLQAPFNQGGIAHIFFNMFALYMFGRILEVTWGSKRYAFYYFVCGIGAALIQELVWTATWHSDFASALAAENHTTVSAINDFLSGGSAQALQFAAQFKDMLLTIGASGAIFGLLLGFGCVFPNVPTYLMFIPIPIKAKWLVLGYGALELVLGVSGSLDSVAHFAHLGGMIFGAVILYIWHKKGLLHSNYGRRN